MNALDAESEFIREIIRETMQTTSTILMNELKRHRMLKSTKDSAFIKTEKLLYNYRKFKQIVQQKLKEIETIETEGLQRKSKSLVMFSKNNTFGTDTELELAEARIESIRESIDKMQEYISMIDSALGKITNDHYYGIIRMKYFEGCNHEECADHFEVDVSTIARNKNRLVNTLKIHLFTDDAVVELFD